MAITQHRPLLQIIYLQNNVWFILEVKNGTLLYWCPFPFSAYGPISLFLTSPICKIDFLQLIENRTGHDNSKSLHFSDSCPWLQSDLLGLQSISPSSAMFSLRLIFRKLTRNNERRHGALILQDRRQTCQHNLHLMLLGGCLHASTVDITSALHLHYAQQHKHYHSEQRTAF